MAGCGTPKGRFELVGVVRRQVPIWTVGLPGSRDSLDQNVVGWRRCPGLMTITCQPQDGESPP
jgi:hypothetical protein